MRKWVMGFIVVLASVNLAGCGYNKLQNQDEGVKAAWSEVVNQYQRRADLIPNLVAAVKGFAAQEERVLVGVTEARARASSIQITPEVLNNPETFAKYQEAQAQITTALKTLLATVEAYPDLKSDANFRDLQAQLEGTENRITVARNRYIESVKEFNVTVREFPTNITANMFDYDVK
ncbi:MAG TPA: LemA family protein, partial [Steroidobacteraceae bacterium]|nr:LemA family protein [Steroidobacteraceae bacterium]